jgi:hypothetical protein
VLPRVLRVDLDRPVMEPCGPMVERRLAAEQVSRFRAGGRIRLPSCFELVCQRPSLPFTRALLPRPRGNGELVIVHNSLIPLRSVRKPKSAPT